MSPKKSSTKRKEAKSGGDEGSKPTLVENGIIYIFTRVRVNVEEPDSVDDLQRTYFVLRPIEPGTKIKDVVEKDESGSRLFALPKKVFPRHSSDRPMAFVEKGQTTIKELKEIFFPGEEYETKTMGTRHQHPVMPVAEGVYSITKLDRSSYLTYILTIPKKIDEVQEQIGLQEKGSFLISIKNPEKSSPAQARLPDKAEYPKDLQDEFGNYAWIPVQQSRLLDFDNVQVLLVGHGDDTSRAKKIKPSADDEKEEEQIEDLEQLAYEDAQRISGNDSMFDDLEISKNDYPDVASTWHSLQEDITEEHRRIEEKDNTEKVDSPEDQSSGDDKPEDSKQEDSKQGDSKQEDSKQGDIRDYGTAKSNT